MVTWEISVTGLQESLQHCGPEKAAGPSGDSISNVKLRSCVLVAQSLSGEYLLAASLPLLGGESCFPTQVSGHAGVGAPQVTLL